VRAGHSPPDLTTFSLHPCNIFRPGLISRKPQYGGEGDAPHLRQALLQVWREFLLGHSSIQTTERYLGCVLAIAMAVNNNLAL
jgi:hypothetical protein